MFLIYLSTFVNKYITYLLDFLLIFALFKLFSGIFAYLNYLTPKSRREILELLVGGLKRLEYRGYDSAGKISF